MTTSLTAVQIGNESSATAVTQRNFQPHASWKPGHLIKVALSYTAGTATVPDADWFPIGPGNSAPSTDMRILVAAHVYKTSEYRAFLAGTFLGWTFGVTSGLCTGLAWATPGPMVENNDMGIPAVSTISFATSSATTWAIPALDTTGFPSTLIEYIAFYRDNVGASASPTLGFTGTTVSKLGSSVHFNGTDISQGIIVGELNGGPKAAGAQPAATASSSLSTSKTGGITIATSMAQSVGATPTLPVLKRNVANTAWVPIS